MLCFVVIEISGKYHLIVAISPYYSVISQTFRQNNSNIFGEINQYSCGHINNNKCKIALSAVTELVIEQNQQFIMCHSTSAAIKWSKNHHLH